MRTRRFISIVLAGAVSISSITVPTKAVKNKYVNDTEYNFKIIDLKASLKANGYDPNEWDFTVINKLNIGHSVVITKEDE